MASLAHLSLPPRAGVAATTLALLALGLGAMSAQARGISFTKPLKLRNTPPKGELQGGEPSVAFDRDGNHVYVVAPGGGENGGVGFWRSGNRGRTFTKGRSLGSILGGGDSDVSVGPDHTVYIADLEVVANALCRSNDYGKSFDSNCDTGIASNQTGPESDREWVSPSPTNPNLVYFSYHDITTETPLVYRSQSAGAPGSFIPCGPVLEPGSEAEANYVPGGTNQGKLAIGSGGDLYVPILEPTNPALITDPYNNFYMAISRNGCAPGASFHDVTVYSNPRANLANIFPYVAARGHTIYAAFTGISGKRRPSGRHHYGVYLLRSTDAGRHWSQPIAVDRKWFKANALASLTVGKRANQVALGFYRTTTSKNPNRDDDVWKYQVAISRNGGRDFRYTRITDGPIHYGQICNQGILCTGGRNLLDFSSVGVNPKTGCVMAVFAGDPYDTPKNGRDDEAAAYVSRQTHACFR
jgi:hypothetical protein